MPAISTKLATSPNIATGEMSLLFMCPGCGRTHPVRIVGHDPWDWNRDALRPVFKPSVKTTYDGPDAGLDGAPPAVCHLHVGCNGAAPGQIAFLADSTHALAGQTVDLPDLPEHMQ